MEAFLAECMKNDKVLFESKMVKKKFKEFKESDNNSLICLTCSICIDVIQDNQYVKILNCKHSFHNNCINTWLKKDHHNCPLCRKDQNGY
jgi:hypothetical protein